MAPPTADVVAKELGYLPLALVQAGAYMDATGCSLREYLERLERHGIALFGQRHGGLLRADGRGDLGGEPDRAAFGFAPDARGLRPLF